MRYPPPHHGDSDEEEEMVDGPAPNAVRGELTALGGSAVGAVSQARTRQTLPFRSLKWPPGVWTERLHAGRAAVPRCSNGHTRLRVSAHMTHPHAHTRTRACRPWTYYSQRGPARMRPRRCSTRSAADGGKGGGLARDSAAMRGAGFVSATASRRSLFALSRSASAVAASRPPGGSPESVGASGRRGARPPPSISPPSSLSRSPPLAPPTSPR